MRHHNILTVLVSRDSDTSSNVYYLNGVQLPLSNVSSMILHANSTQLVSTYYMEGYTIFTHQISF